VPVSRALFYTCLEFPSTQDLLIKQNLTFISKPRIPDPLHFPPSAPLWRRVVSRAIGLFTHFSQESQFKEISHETGGKYTVTVHVALRGWKDFIQWRTARFPKRMIYDTAVITPLQCSLQHDTFHLGMGRPEPLYQACVVVTLNSAPSTLVTAPHVTQGTNLHVNLWYGRGVGFMGGSFLGRWATGSASRRNK
jgi:hypothetical protein